MFDHSDNDHALIKQLENDLILAFQDGCTDPEILQMREDLIRYSERLRAGLRRLNAREAEHAQLVRDLPTRMNAVRPSLSAKTGDPIELNKKSEEATKLQVDQAVHFNEMMIAQSSEYNKAAVAAASKSIDQFIKSTKEHEEANRLKVAQASEFNRLMIAQASGYAKENEEASKAAVSAASLRIDQFMKSSKECEEVNKIDAQKKYEETTKSKLETLSAKIYQLIELTKKSEEDNKANLAALSEKVDKLNELIGRVHVVKVGEKNESG